jgi:hypothetical protein
MAVEIGIKPLRETPTITEGATTATADGGYLLAVNSARSRYERAKTQEATTSTNWIFRGGYKHGNNVMGHKHCGSTWR